MDIAPDIDRFILFVLLVFPGMVAMRTYRLLMPARQVEWKDSIVEALFFSVLNFAIFFPLIPLIGEDGFPENHRYLFSTIVSMLIIPCPVIITVAYVKPATPHRSPPGNGWAFSDIPGDPPAASVD